MNQTEKVYLISDAAKRVQVEAHVLRYWEEELALPIKRNEMGHRFYTREDIERFVEIRDLKSRGLQLKAIKTLLSKSGTAEEGFEKIDAYVSAAEKDYQERTYQDRACADRKERHVVMVNKGEFLPVAEESREAKSIRLQQLLQTMIAEAVRSSNREVCEEIKESLVKELDYQFRMQQEQQDVREEARISRQEEHYRQIDDLLRSRVKRRNLGQSEAVEWTGRGREKETREKAEREEMEREKMDREKMDREKAEWEEAAKEKPEKRKFGILRKKRSIV